MKLNKVDDKTAYENLLIKYAELENKIADIKANCDLAIEGRDVKIKELELELTVEKDQLTKAKEILEELAKMEYVINPPVDKVRSLMVKAEQFLNSENIILEDAQVGNSPFDADEVFHKEMKAYPEEKVK